MLGGNLALASLLAARWVESGHFPLSNMYESLLFLAWGITVRRGSIPVLRRNRTLHELLHLERQCHCLAA